jgi:tetratricopeptide (TPR) repeat protein
MMTDTRRKIRVFISYAQIDGIPFAEKLHDDLEHREIASFLDVRDIKAGEPIHLLVQANLRNADAILAILTPGAHSSQWFAGEQFAATEDEIPIIPLLAEDGQTPPALGSLKHLDFRHDYIAALELLIERLQTIHQDHLSYLKLKLSELLREQGISRTPERFEPKLQRLRRNLANWEARGRSGPGREIPSSGLQNEGALNEQPGSAPTGATPFVGAPIAESATTFRNRETQVAEVVSLLSAPSTRIVTVVGRGGIGKSALVAHALRRLSEGGSTAPTPIAGVASFSARSRSDIDAEDMRIAFTELLGSSAGERLSRAWSNPCLDMSAKVGALLKELDPGARYVLLLDNVESLLDAGRRFADAELRAFIDACLSVRSPLVLLLTSRAPVALRKELLAHDNHVIMTGGLPQLDAVAMLRALDASGQSGLRNLPTTTLQGIVGMTRGLPRALELVAHMLANDPLLSVDELVTRERFFESEDVVRELLVEAYARLDQSSLTVLQGLAILGRFVPAASVEALLAPFVAPGSVRPILRQLVLVHAASVNRATAMIGIHPLDRDYALATIPVTGEYCRATLHHRAAEYYRASRQPEATWKSPSDVRPQLLEFRHRLAAGEYAEATTILGELDEDYLEVWGFNRRLVSLRRELAAREFDRTQQMRNLVRLARAEHRLGDFEEAIHSNQRAREIALTLGDRDTEATCLNYIGINEHFLGEYENAIVHHKQALLLVPNEPRRKAACLNALGNAYNQTGAYDAARDMHEQSLTIRASLDNRRWISDSFQNRGELELSLGNLTRAFEDFTRELPSTRGGGRWSDALPRLTNGSIVLIERGEYAMAERDLTSALELTRRTMEWRWEDLQRGLLADIDRHRGNYDRAAAAYRQAIELSSATRSRPKRARHLVGLATLERMQGRMQEAISGARDALAETLAMGDATGRARAAAELAVALLLSGDVSEAARIAADALTREVPALHHRILLLDGIAWGKLGDQVRALSAFKSALGYSERLLAASPDFVAVAVTAATAARAAARLATETKQYQTRADEGWARLNGVLTTAPGIKVEVDQMLSAMESTSA